MPGSLEKCSRDVQAKGSNSFCLSHLPAAKTAPHVWPLSVFCYLPPPPPALSPPAWPKPVSDVPQFPLRRGEGPLRGEGVPHGGVTRVRPRRKRIVVRAPAPQRE